jgi:hypothetical protein
MEDLLTANRFSGRATGATFLTFFGAAWIGLSLYIREQLTPATGVPVALIACLLLLAALRLFRLSRRFPSVAEDPRVSRAFHLINSIQWIAAGIAGFTLNRLHLDAYLFSAIAAIVGLHMLPLARVFRYAPHYVTGSALVIWAVLSCLLVPVEHLQGAAALGTGMILWSSGASTLIAALPEATKANQAGANRSGAKQVGPQHSVSRA